VNRAACALARHEDGQTIHAVWGQRRESRDERLRSPAPHVCTRPTPSAGCSCTRAAPYPAGSHRHERECDARVAGARRWAVNPAGYVGALRRSWSTRFAHWHNRQAAPRSSRRGVSSQETGDRGQAGDPADAHTGAWLQAQAGDAPWLCLILSCGGPSSGLTVHLVQSNGHQARCD
jgi:hypothetical protein